MSFSVTGISLVAARTQLPEASPTFMALLKDLEEGRKLKVVFALNNEYKRAAMSEEELREQIVSAAFNFFKKAFFGYCLLEEFVP